MVPIVFVVSRPVPVRMRIELTPMSQAADVWNSCSFARPASASFSSLADSLSPRRRGHRKPSAAPRCNRRPSLRGPVRYNRPSAFCARRSPRSPALRIHSSACQLFCRDASSSAHVADAERNLKACELTWLRSRRHCNLCAGSRRRPDPGPGPPGWDRSLDESVDRSEHPDESQISRQCPCSGQVRHMRRTNPENRRQVSGIPRDIPHNRPSSRLVQNVIFMDTDFEVQLDTRCRHRDSRTHDQSESEGVMNHGLKFLAGARLFASAGATRDAWAVSRQPRIGFDVRCPVPRGAAPASAHLGRPGTVQLNRSARLRSMTGCARGWYGDPSPGLTGVTNIERAAASSGGPSSPYCFKFITSARQYPSRCTHVPAFTQQQRNSASSGRRVEAAEGSARRSGSTSWSRRSSSTTTAIGGAWRGDLRVMVRRTLSAMGSGTESSSDQELGRDAVAASTSCSQVQMQRVSRAARPRPISVRRSGRTSASADGDELLGGFSRTPEEQGSTVAAFLDRL